MAASALRFNTALAARLTTYSTFGSVSRKSKTSGAAKPPSKRTRILAPGKASFTRGIRRRRMPTAPAEAGALPPDKAPCHRGDKTAQDAHRPRRGRRVPRPQHRRHQILLVFLIQGQKSH